MATTENLIKLVISGRERDIGGFAVRRLLPHATQRMVGPFIFFDHMGPAEFEPGHGMDVRPHPHINLATVTYLFEGTIQHKDSLGNDLPIEPGAINWMTAGRGIVHSERTPSALRNQKNRLHGIQLWVALPEDVEEIDPQFSHHPKETLPEFFHQGVFLKLLLGEKFGHKSPVPTYSDFFYLESKITKGKEFEFPIKNEECAVYVVAGKIRVEETVIERFQMVVLSARDAANIFALEDAHLMLIGGKSVGQRLIDWNFVSSSKDRILEAKNEWKGGPKPNGSRFRPIPNDEEEYIPL